MPESAPAAPGSHFAGRSTAARAIDIVMPSIEAAMADSRFGESGCLHIVVLDPARPPGSCPFEEAILVERSVGDPSHWDADYAGMARAKARLSWKHRADSRLVQTHAPQRLERGDTLLWGSAYLDGIVVAMSGFHPCYDEAFSCAIAACLRALAREARELIGGGVFID
jgi:hypothetical protein